MIVLNLARFGFAVKPAVDCRKRHPKFLGKLLLGNLMFETEPFEVFDGMHDTLHFIAFYLKAQVF